MKWAPAATGILEAKHEDGFNVTNSMTDNISGVVESLLSEFVERESRERLVKTIRHRNYKLGLRDVLGG
jgi:hypothetical protein